jgi:hypothetical protein
MSSGDFILGPAPTSSRRRELWLQHAAGFILFEDVRGYAIRNLDPALDETARAAALKAVDDAVYGLMMVIDGVTGGLWNSEYRVDLKTTVRLMRRGAESDECAHQLDLFDGDGMCMGFHGWLEGDFGNDSVAISKSDGRKPD